MHIGLIGGIGPAATDHYYRGLIRAVAVSGSTLELTIAHTDAPTLLENLTHDNGAAQAVIFANLIGQLQAAGAQAAAITSIAGHFCIGELTKISPLPVIDIIGEVDAALKKRNLQKVGLIGTRKVMDSGFYGGLPTVDIMLPDARNLDRVHDSYVEMAMSGKVTDAQRQVFFSAGRRLVEDYGAGAIVLGGTDLFLAFDGADCGFDLVDCADIHIGTLARVATGDIIIENAE